MNKKRILSAVLILCLIFTSAITVIPASATSPNNDSLINSIKTAWQKLEIAPEVLFDKFWESTATSTPLAGTPTEIDGKTVNTYDCAGKAIYITGVDNYSGSNSLINVDDYQSIYLYIKADAIYTNSFSAVSSKNSKVVSIPILYRSSNVGNWMKVELLSEIKGDTNYPYFNGTNTEANKSYFGRAQFSNRACQSSVVMGIKTFEEEFGFNLDDTTEWTLEDWLTKALEFDFTKYGNSEELIELLNSNADYLANVLRNEWAKLKNKPEVLLGAFWLNNSKDEPLEATPTEIDGETVDTYDCGTSNIHISGRNAYQKPDFDINVDDYESIYLYVNADSSSTKSFSVVPSLLSSKYFIHNYVVSENGAWQKIEILSDIKNHANYPYFNGTNEEATKSYLGRIQFNNRKVQASVVMGLRKFSVPDFDDWSATQLLEAADSLDLTGFQDTEAFEAAKVNLDKCLSTTDIDYSINKIKDAWNNVEIAPEVLLGTFWDNSDTSTPLEGTPTEIDGETVDTYNCGTSNIHISGEKGYSKPDFDINVDDYESIYVYVNADSSSTKNFTVASSSYSKYFIHNYSSAYSASDNGTWKKIEILSAIKENANYPYFKGTNEEATKSYLGRVQFNNKKVQASVVMGIKTFEEKFGFNLDDTTAWDISQWIEAAEDADFSNCNNVETLQKYIGYAEELLTKLEKELQPLMDLLLDNDANYEEYYDFNNDDSNDIRDLVRLKKMLLKKKIISDDNIPDQSIGSADLLFDTITKQEQTVFTPITLGAAKTNAASYMSALASDVSVDNMTSVTSATSNSDNFRLAKLFEKALAGQNITIATIGGSITNATYLTNQEQDKKYANRIQAWFEATFPNIEVTLVNAGIGSTSSSFGLYRLRKDVLIYDPDLIVIEYAVNDNHDYLTKTYEGLLRTALNYEDVAVVPLYLTNKAKGTAQSKEKPIVDHYGLPQASFLDAYNSYSDWNDMFRDDVHPNSLGHGRAALVFNQLLTTALNNYESAQESYTIPSVYYNDIAVYGNDYIVELQYEGGVASFLTKEVEGNSLVEKPLTGKITSIEGEYSLKEDNKRLGSYTFDIISVKAGDTITFNINDIRSLMFMRYRNPDGGNATVTVTESGTNKQTSTNLNNYLSSSVLWDSEPLYKSSDGNAHTVTVSITATDAEFCFEGFGLTD